MKKTLNILVIRIDGGTQPRASINLDAVNEYAEAITSGASLPPPTVFHDGADYWLADGFHRYHANKKIGAVSLECEVIEGTQRDAILHSLSANQTHGLRRTNEDKRKAVMTMLNDPDWVKWSDTDIARFTGTGRQFVVGVRSSLTCHLVTSEPEPLKRLYTRNGKTFEMNVSKIGKGRSATQEPFLSDEDVQILRSVPFVDGQRSTVYVLGSKGQIKVGFSGSAARRCEDLLQQRQGGVLLAAAAGLMKDERKVHELLAPQREHGEWFVCELADVIDAMQAAGLNPKLTKHGTQALEVSPSCDRSQDSTQAVMKTGAIGKKPAEPVAAPVQAVALGSENVLSFDDVKDAMSDTEEESADVLKQTIQKYQQELDVKDRVIASLSKDDQAAQIARLEQLNYTLEVSLSREMDKSAELQRLYNGYGKWYADLRKATGLESRAEILEFCRQMAKEQQS
jgi:hypothetical protein